MMRAMKRAFSAIELIGVLAILVILAAWLFPRMSRTVGNAGVVQTVNDAKVTEALAALQAVRTAAAAHVAQYGSLASLKGIPLTFSGTYDQFGQILLTEGLLERPFALSLGDQAFLRLVNVAGLSPASAVDGTSGAFDLDGDGKNDVAGASFVVEAVIPGVTEADAQALNDRLDGPRNRPGADDLTGSIIYRHPPLGGRTEVHIYILRK
jgi:type II secretory pathway pseudopilin PulG